MPATSNRRGGEEKNKKGRLLSDKTFNGRDVQFEIPRPKTVPELMKSAAEETAAPLKKLSKLLVNVTIQRSPGAVQVVIPPESTVKDLIATALRQYHKEARRPVLPSSNPAGFQLHYSQFSLESLDMEEKVMTLGSRNFFLCPKDTAETNYAASGGCSKEVERVNKKGLPWLKLMEFLL